VPVLLSFCMALRINFYSIGKTTEIFVTQNLKHQTQNIIVRENLAKQTCKENEGWGGLQNRFTEKEGQYLKKNKEN
jgi:hypothetical protein